MSQRKRWIAACVVALLLGFPRAGSAGFWEVIIEMSGPQMVGVPVECRIGLSGGATFEYCKWLWDTFNLAGRGRNEETRLWLTLEGGPYFATGVGANGDLYNPLDVYMLTFDPLLEVRSLGGTQKRALYHGAGFTTNFLFGDNFKRFGNAGFKVRPVGVVFPIGGRASLDLSLTLRIYPTEFTPADFGVAGSPTDDVEVVKSIVGAIRF